MEDWYKIFDENTVTTPGLLISKKNIDYNIKQMIKSVQSSGNGSPEELEARPNLNDLLADYDLEEWAKEIIKTGVDANDDRNTIINNVIIRAKKELNKTISISCLHDEWIIDGRIKFKI